jgi:hypothetical protein
LQVLAGLLQRAAGMRQQSAGAGEQRTGSAMKRGREPLGAPLEHRIVAPCRMDAQTIERHDDEDRDDAGKQMSVTK